MIHGLLTSSCVAGALFAASAVRAQPKEPSSSPFVLRRGEAGGADAKAARGRARAGDCAGALPSFDAAIRTTLAPELRRDRGLCHEKLGHPFPAIDDYRAYLIAQPDAPDSDQIRERLAALEAQAGIGGPSSQSMKKTRDRDAPKATGAGARFSIGGDGVEAADSTNSTDSTEGRPAESAYSYEDAVAQEQLADVAETSPLRYGSGFVLGPFLHLPRFFVGERAPDGLGYGVGAALRYATGPTVSIISEIGYAGVGTSGAASSQAGPLLMGGVELRLPVSRFAGDHVLLRGGLGYERYRVSGTRAVSNNLLGRFGVGYRHVFGPSLGLEILADGGPAYMIPESANSRLNFVLGASFAFVVGF